MARLPTATQDSITAMVCFHIFILLCVSNCATQLTTIMQATSALRVSRSNGTRIRRPLAQPTRTAQSFGEQLASDNCLEYSVC